MNKNESRLRERAAVTCKSCEDKNAYYNILCERIKSNYYQLWYYLNAMRVIALQA